MKTLLALVAMISLSTQALACPSAPFTARDSGGKAVAKIQGNRILSSGWSVYSRGETEDYKLTRYSKKGSKNALWLYEAKDRGLQPGIIWGVWYDAGMIEGFANKYEIQTNLRGFSQGEAKLTRDPRTGNYQVHCG